MNTSCVTGKPLHTKRLPSGERELLQPLNVRTCKYVITVRAGFQTDFSSIPTGLSWLVRWSRVDIAGVVHDMLFCPNGYGLVLDKKNPAKNLVCTLSIKDADKIWLEIARRGKHRAWLLGAWLCYIGLYSFGWCTWNGYRCCKKRRVPWYCGIGRLFVGAIVVLILISVVFVVVRCAFLVTAHLFGC